MTPRPGGSPDDALAPLTAALLDRAQRQAAELLADADRDAEAAVARARTQAEDQIAAARAKGEADAADVLAAERARAEREARAMVLAAQQAAHQRVRQAAREAISGLRDDAAYPQLLAALRDRARHELGPGAAIVELPSGGIRASSGDRRVEFALDGLADDLLDAVGSDITELWEP